MAAVHLASALAALSARPLGNFPFHGVCQNRVRNCRVRATATGPSNQPSSPGKDDAGATNASAQSVSKNDPQENRDETLSSKPVSDGSNSGGDFQKNVLVDTKNEGKEISPGHSHGVLESVFTSLEGPPLPFLWGSIAANNHRKKTDHHGISGRGASGGRGTDAGISVLRPSAPGSEVKASVLQQDVRNEVSGSKEQKWKKDTKHKFQGGGSGKLKAKDVRKEPSSSLRRPEARAEEEKDFSKEFVVDRIRTLVQSCKQELVRLGSGTDDDVIHDLRIQMRRLRSVLRMLSPIIGTPIDISKLSKILRSLGSVRDTDVQKDLLSSVRASAGCMSKREQERVEETFHDLNSSRRKLTSKAGAALRSKDTSRVMGQLEEWLSSPTLSLPPSPSRGVEGVEIILPSLLTPHAASLFLHPGWYITNVPNEMTQRHEKERGGSTPTPTATPPPSPPKWTPVERKRGECVHDLRKHLRELRYHLESLQLAYSKSEAYSQVLHRIHTLQTLLGSLHDLQVMALYLQTRYGSLKKTPALAMAIYKQYWEVWSKWKSSVSTVFSSSEQEMIYCTLVQQLAVPT